jgi:hypothetical protein
MVQQGDFNVQLVNATTKIPFLEHTRENGDTFVEAEPDAEYFIQWQKTAAVNWGHVPYLVLEFLVDGTRLGFGCHFSSRSITALPSYAGPTDFANGKYVTGTLQFYIPNSRPTTDEEFNVDRFVEKMGRVDIRLYEGWQRYTIAQASSVKPSTFDGSGATFALSRDGREKDKAVLSARGSSTLSQPELASSHVVTTGQLLDTITLRYCSVKGLQLVGILSPPTSTVWVTPLPPRKVKKVRYTEEVVNVGRNGLVNEVMVVTILDDSSSEDEEDEGKEDQTKTKTENVKLS